MASQVLTHLFTFFTLVSGVSAWRCAKYRHYFSQQPDYIDCFWDCCGNSFNRHCCSPIGIIVGCSIVGAVVVAAITVLFICWYQRRRARRTKGPKLFHNRRHSHYPVAPTSVTRPAPQLSHGPPPHTQRAGYPPYPGDRPPPQRGYGPGGPGPRPQGYGPPPNQGYGPPPNQGYRGPPPNQGYRGPPPNQGYRGPPPNQGYRGPPPNQGYRGPPPQQYYDSDREVNTSIEKPPIHDFYDSESDRVKMPPRPAPMEEKPPRGGDIDI